MCGFVGQFASERRLELDEPTVGRMLRLLAHRGPDGEAFHREPGVTLAFRRLAIVDLLTGMQPLANEDQTAWLVFNGEIYNYRELRADLVSRGHRFRTLGDAETVVHAYEEWDEACPEKLRGIFAFAVWDRRRRRMFLARDRSGIKPLYVWRRPGDFRFASEAKALLASPDVERRLDIPGSLLPSGVDPSFERTAFAGVSQLGPGCSLSVSAEGERLRRYWRYEPVADGDPPGDITEADLVLAFREELLAAVRMQLMADVPLAAYLSGGVDSGAIVAAMSRAGYPGFPTYTTVFDDHHSEDPPYSALCAAHLGLQARFVRCPFDRHMLALVPYVAWMAEGDFDLGFPARYLLARRARRDGVKVILTGQGIDEILTGYYPDFRAFVRQTTLANFDTRTSGYGARPLFHLLTDRAITEEIADAEASLVADRLRMEHSRLSLYLLRFEDRMGMAAGVEVRVPFLDHRLLELCARIPHRLRMSLLSGKSLLRQAVESWLPADLVRRPKYAFNANAVSISHLVLSSRASRGESGAIAQLRALLSREAIVEKGYFDPAPIGHLLETNAFRTLDGILMIHLLDDLFVAGRGLAEPVPEPDLEPEELVVPAPRSAPARREALGAAARDRAEARAQDVPRFSRLAAGLRLFHRVDPVSRSLRPARTLFVHFSTPGQPALPLPGDTATLGLLRLVDGRSSYRSIARALRGRLSLASVLALATQLARCGVLEHARSRPPSPRRPVERRRGVVRRAS